MNPKFLLARENRNCNSLVPQLFGKHLRLFLSAKQFLLFLFAVSLWEPVLRDICTVTDCQHKNLSKNGVGVLLYCWLVRCTLVKELEKFSLVTLMRRILPHTHIDTCVRPCWPQKLSTLSLLILLHIFSIVCQHHVVNMNACRLGISKLLIREMRLHPVLYHSPCIFSSICYCVCISPV